MKTNLRTLLMSIDFLLVFIFLLVSSQASVLRAQNDEPVDLGNGCNLVQPTEALGETYECGTFTVPVDYSNPESATIELTYVVLRASGEDPAPDPIVMLAGGPGQSAVVLANASPYGALRETHDLVFPAQRGTLYAQPYLDCPDLTTARLETGSAGTRGEARRDAITAAMQAC